VGHDEQDRQPILNQIWHPNSIVQPRMESMDVQFSNTTYIIDQMINSLIA